MLLNSLFIISPHLRYILLFLVECGSLPSLKVHNGQKLGASYGKLEM